jgi:hypothetical protein
MGGMDFEMDPNHTSRLPVNCYSHYIPIVLVSPPALFIYPFHCRMVPPLEWLRAVLAMQISSRCC